MAKQTTEPKVDARRPKPHKRVPLHEQRDQLTVLNGEDGFVYRWVNDVDNGQRIQKFEKAGYEVAPDQHEIGDPVGENDRFAVDKTSTVTRKHVGSGTHAVLMRTRQEWYDEDQAAKQARIDELEESMRQSSLQKFGEIRNPTLRIDHGAKGKKAV